MLGLTKFANGSISYIPLLWGHIIGSYVRYLKCNPRNLPINQVGNFTRGYFLRKNYIISNITPISKHRPIYARAAGTFCRVFEKLDDFNIILIILPTGSKRYIHKSTTSYIGRNSNWERRFTSGGKAGLSINMGFKQKVRGVAKNPVDHPNGGRTKTKVPKKSIWGWIAKKGK